MEGYICMHFEVYVGIIVYLRLWARQFSGITPPVSGGLVLPLRRKKPTIDLLFPHGCVSMFDPRWLREQQKLESSQVPRALRVKGCGGVSR